MAYERFNAPIPVQRDRRNTETGGIILTKAEAIKWLEETKFGGAMLGDKQVIAVCDMAIAALREQAERRWIPVTERLPEPFERVIVCREDGKVEQGCKDVRDWWKVYGSRTKHVTHWMPLPEPPKEDTE